MSLYQITATKVNASILRVSSLFILRSYLVTTNSDHS